jgi:ribosomal subunit interface protein
MTMTVTAQPIPVHVTLRGHAGRHDRDYARTKVEQALAVAPGAVLRAHVVLERRPDPAVRRQARAEATVDVAGTTLRAHAVEPTMHEAVDELEARLRRQLVRMRDRSRTRHRWTGIAEEHEWRHGDRRREPVPYFPRPEGSRDVVRRKSFASAPMTVDEAAYEMDLLDHDFYLFTHVTTGEPVLVHRLPEGGYGVQGGPEEATVGPVTREPDPPALTNDLARARMDAGQEPFLFYCDPDTGEGRVLYRRYDGHYGLIVLTD